MMNKQIILSCAAVLISGIAMAQQQTDDVLDYIRPEIGGVGTLLEPTRPTMQLPNEMMRMTPVRKDYLDDQISSFPLLLVSHRLGQLFAMQPNTDEHLSESSWKARLSYDQGAEERAPWHYYTNLVEKDVTVEYTPGRKVGYYRFSFPAQGAKRLLFNTYDRARNWWRFDNDSTIAGMQVFTAEDGLKDIPVYVYGRFNQPATSGGWANGDATTLRELEGKAWASFDKSEVTLRYAVSFISEAQAKQNFELELGGGQTFEMVAANARQAWQEVIGQIAVEGGTPAQRRSFYTALYRCYERMVNITENGKYYSGYDNKVHTDDRPFYVDDWVWDTYLALHPLRSILLPEREEDMLQSYVRMYEQSGWMPTFPVVYGDHACMNGFHSSVMFLDAYRKGLRNFDVAKAYAGMRKNATSATMLPWRNGPKTELDDFYHTKGYFPALKPGEKDPVPQVHSFEKRQAVAVTLGGAYDDWAVGQLAADLGKAADAKLFTARGQNYHHLWNADRQFFLPKDSAGNWIPIDPVFDGGMGGREYYDENNGWTYMWQVQQDIPGLIKLMKGKEGFENRLDQLFREGLGRSRYEFWAKFPDATGLVGQYSMGNEPSFFIPYLYNYTKSPWKTQQRIRLLLKTWFDDNIFGIPGDEDGGGMSAFVVFSSIGFYPVTPGDPVYTIGSPVFSKVRVHLKNGKDFTVIANNCSEVNKYIQSARLNGVTINTPWFTHDQLMSGGTLELEMGSKPNKRWGIE
ncbi:alpha-1,2-mannosidase, putative [Chitinophaga jiangningensis]|uniref:Alpha-1,2-mannosidase, putative n=1 Tax=Chitinophaga jiangningensis TaxID=1419482 RepID=A0A1M7J7A1_9BACT|nr:GH92 family glycosyl hydrolase [Chitinophaga jiangningensis]SHM48896.1 alpha-1,2-mannosidase, putative [Chitinophaga jiangningensis]